MAKSIVVVHLLANARVWVFVVKHLRHLCQQTIETICIGHHVTRQKSNMALLNRVRHSIDTDGSLQPSFYHILLLHQTNKHIRSKNHPTVDFMLLTRASTVPNEDTNNVNHPAYHINWTAIIHDGNGDG